MSNPNLKKIDKYMVHLDKKIGVGSFGTVYISFHTETQEKVAIKMLDKKTIQKDQYIKAALIAEIEILKTLKSNNTVGFLDVMESSNYYYIVQEYCDGGDLRNLINKRGCINEQQAIGIISQVCNGFIQLLKQGIIHRDLKPQNILLNKGVIKICDFGFSKRNNNKRLKYNTIVGTPLYMSIQILKGEPYTSKCDIWALGFIFYELLHGTPPWNASSEYQLINVIESSPLKFTKDLSPITKDFISKCLAIRQQNRLNWDQLLRHQIFKGTFAHYVKKQYEFQNKFKAIMGQIRYQINSQNIQLEKLIEKQGFSATRDLDFQAFHRVMRAIDDTLTIQQLRYIFQKLDRDDSNSISLGQLETAMIQNNILVKPQYILPKKQSFTMKGGVLTPNTGLTMNNIVARVTEAFLKLDQKLKTCKITLEEVFLAYDGSRKGEITLEEFKLIIKRLDPSMNDEDIKQAFQLIDVDSSGMISLREFESYYLKCTSGKQSEMPRRKTTPM